MSLDGGAEALNHLLMLLLLQIGSHRRPSNARRRSPVSHREKDFMGTNRDDKTNLKPADREMYSHLNSPFSCPATCYSDRSRKGEGIFHTRVKMRGCIVG